MAGNGQGTGVSAHGRLVAILVVDMLAVAFGLVGLGLAFSQRGLGTFEMYTEDSNIIALVACAIGAAFCWRELSGGGVVPRWVHVLKFVGASCLAVTFVTVICVLVPMMCMAGQDGVGAMLLTGSMPFMHVFCPILVIGSFVLLDEGRDLAVGDVRIALLPTIVYALAVITLNLVRVIEGPYPFLRVYDQPVWASVLWVCLMMGGAAALAWVLLRINVSRRRTSV